MTRIAALLFAWAFALPAAAAVRPATPANIDKVLASARSGDTVQAAGEFDQIVVNKRDFGPAGLTLDLSKAKLQRLAVTASKRIAIVRGAFVPGAVKEQLLIVGSDSISITEADFLAEGKAYCVRAVDSTNLKVLKSRFDHCFQGVNFGRITGFTISGNAFTASFNDSIALTAPKDFRIESNNIGGNLRVDGRHPDGIQFVNKKDGNRGHGGVVRFNTITGATQGIFGGGVDGVDFDNNTITIDHGNALSVGGCVGCRVRNNRISTLPGAVNIANMNYWTADTMRCGNRIEPFNGKKGLVEPACKSAAANDDSAPAAPR